MNSTNHFFNDPFVVFVSSEIQIAKTLHNIPQIPNIYSLHWMLIWYIEAKSRINPFVRSATPRIHNRNDQWTQKAANTSSHLSQSHYRSTNFFIAQIGEQDCSRAKFVKFVYYRLLHAQGSNHCEKCQISHQNSSYKHRIRVSKLQYERSNED